MTHEIVIFVLGGVVQHIEGIPPNFTVLVRDYDVDPDDDPNYPRDGQGDPYFEGIWAGEKLDSANNRDPLPNHSRTP